MQGNGQGAGEGTELKEFSKIKGTPKPTADELQAKTRAGRLALSQLKGSAFSSFEAERQSPLGKKVTVMTITREGPQETIRLVPFKPIKPTTEQLKSVQLGRRGGGFTLPITSKVTNLALVFKHVDVTEQAYGALVPPENVDSADEPVILLRKALKRLGEILPSGHSEIPTLSLERKEAILYSILRFFEILKKRGDIKENLLRHYAAYLGNDQYFTHLICYIGDLLIKCQDIGAVNPLLKAIEDYIKQTNYFGPMGSRAKEEAFVDRRSVDNLMQQLTLWVLPSLKSFYELAEPYLTEESTPEERAAILDIIANTEDWRASFEACRQALMILCEIANNSSAHEALARIMKEANPGQPHWWEDMLENVVALAKAPARYHPLASPDSSGSRMDLLAILQTYLPQLEQALTLQRQPDSPWRAGSGGAAAGESTAEADSGAHHP